MQVTRLVAGKELGFLVGVAIEDFAEILNRGEYDQYRAADEACREQKLQELDSGDHECVCHRGSSISLLEHLRRKSREKTK
jgi:hypothetical protein